MEFLNIAAYKFVDIQTNELPTLHKALKKKCYEYAFKGTVLISREGLNLMLSGDSEKIGYFKDWITTDKRFCDLDFKISFSDYQPFNRMLIKIKSEIIAFGIERIRPAEFTAPYISPHKLKMWLEGNKDLILLDARNSYETRLGSFKGARKLPIDVFRAFPYAVKSLLDSDKSTPLVTYCTGGIRCEKAAALLLKNGFKEVYQLKGGIINYFQECGDSHYEGECFIYDQRVSLNSELKETETVQCFNCSQPVTKEEQKSKSYIPEVSCPYCVNGKPIKSPSPLMKLDV